jgi:hypothetical protein
MSNASFMSNAGLGALAGRGGGGKDILSNSIMELSMAGGGAGNTSIMDLRTGYDKSNMRDMSNMSLVLGKKGGERSFVSNRQGDSFYSKKREPQNKEDDIAMADDSASMCSGSAGDIQRVDSDSDSDDCEIENTDAKARSTGFFKKMLLRENLKIKPTKLTVFREGESDEYNSEVDGLELDVPELTYDIEGISHSSSAYHQPLLELVVKFGELPEDFENLLTFDAHLKRR